MGDRKHLGRRLLALTGLCFLLSGLLAALSFVVVALVAFAVPLLALLAVGGLWLLRSFRIRSGLGTFRIRSGLRTALVSTERAFRKLEAPIHDLGFRQRLQRLGVGARELATNVPGLGVRAWKLATNVPDRAEVFLARAVRRYAIAVYWLRMQASRALRDDGTLATVLARLASRPPGRSRQAFELNELGAQLRSGGEPKQAAEQHRVALAIARDLGDEQAEALTLNNLALALAQGGAEAEAVRHLEQALDVFRELGDEEHEGRVIANLGLVHRRQGHSEEAVSLLHEALDKLPPDSSAYRRVEAELHRAS